MSMNSRTSCGFDDFTIKRLSQGRPGKGLLVSLLRFSRPAKYTSSRQRKSLQHLKVDMLLEKEERKDWREHCKLDKSWRSRTLHLILFELQVGILREIQAVFHKSNIYRTTEMSPGLPLVIFDLRTCPLDLHLCSPLTSSQPAVHNSVPSCYKLQRQPKAQRSHWTSQDFQEVFV